MEVQVRHEVKAFRKKDDGSRNLGAVEIEDLETGAIEEHRPAGVFVYIGLDPNTGFLDGMVDLDERGFVATDLAFMSSMPGVFAAGDVRDGMPEDDGTGEDDGMSMEPSQIFELIVKADEKLKYATADRSGTRRQQAKDLLAQAVEAAREIGNDGLVQQAELRLADLG
jgi:thioredoxin reductase